MNIYVKNESPDTFQKVINYLNDNNIKLVEAVHDFNCSQDGQAYMFFPIWKL